MQLDWLINALKNTVAEYMGGTLEEEKLDNLWGVNLFAKDEDFAI